MAKETPLFARQPFALGYMAFALARALIVAPAWGLIYAIPSMRPNNQWTFRQAFMSKMFKQMVVMVSATQIDDTAKPEKIASKKNWVLIPAAPAKLVKGVLDDAVVKPQAIAALWYPAPYDPSSNDRVMLQIHGGGFVVGDAASIATGGEYLHKHANVTILGVEYRKSNDRSQDNRFPAAVQDALAAYHYLLNDMKIPASKIVLAGDSAGGNLALALMRYLGEHPVLPDPKALVLISPWVHLHENFHAVLHSNPRYDRDYLTADFLEWGSTAYTPSSAKRSDAYLSPLLHPFALRVPTWVQTATDEVFYDENVAFVDAYSKVSGNKVELSKAMHANHDVMWIAGPTFGFTKQMEEGAILIGDFLGRHGM